MLQSRILLGLDNGKKYILLPSNRFYPYCVKYLHAVPILPEPNGDIPLYKLLILPEEIRTYASIDESLSYMHLKMFEIISEIEEIHSIWWTTSNWKFKGEYDKKINKFISILTGFCFLNRMDMIEVEAECLENELGEEDNVYTYLYEIIQVERSKWLKIQNLENSNPLTSRL